MNIIQHRLVVGIATGMLVGAALCSTAEAAVSLSCSAAGDNCLPLQGKISAADEGTIEQGPRVVYFAAAADAASGRLAASSSLADVDDGSPPGAFIQQTGANLFAQFTLFGPPGTLDPVPLTGLFSFHGTISTSVCTSFLQCEAQIAYTAQLSGFDVNNHSDSFKATFGAGRTTGQPILTSNFNVTGANASGALQFDPSGDGASAMLSAMVRPGYQFTLDLSLSAIAAFGNTAPQGATAVAEAGNTALFNFILPEGYSLQATPGFLSTPLLFPEPVPLPAGIVLLASGLPVLGACLRRRRRL